MLDTTLLLFYNSSSSQFEIRDKSFNIIDTFILPSSRTQYHWDYDEYRQLLWIYTNDGYLYRIHIAYNGVTVTRTIQLELSVGWAYMTQRVVNQLVINPNSGDCYIASNSSATTTVGRIKVDSAIIDNTIILPRPQTYNSTQHASLIFIDPMTHYLFVLVSFQWTTNTITSSRRFQVIYIIDPELYDYKEAASYYTMAYTMYPYNTRWGCYFNTSATEDFNRGMSGEFNPISNKVFSTIGFRPDTGHFYKTDNGILGWATRPLDIYGMNWMCCGTNKSTGEYYLFNDSRLLVKDVNFTTTHEYTWTDFSTKYIMYDRYTNEIYRYNNSTYYMYIYDKYGKLTTEYYEAGFTPNRFIFLYGGDSVTDSFQNIIVSPKSNVKTSDRTPTIIARVGISPKGKTQQFRLVCDRSRDKVQTGLIDDTYEIVADSHVISSSYKAWNWQYSEDYNIYSGEGSWSNLGVSAPQNSGGTEPTNGLDCHAHFSRFVKVTIPESDALEGQINDEEWYFKIYSLFE